MFYLIVFQSATQAQAASGILSRHGIRGTVGKPPLSLGRGSCSHGVKIAATDYPLARNVLRSGRSPVLGAWMVTPQGRYEEVAF